MIYTSSITKKGQVTIPAPIRRLFDLTEGARVFIEANQREEAITLIPKKSIFELAGKFKPKKAENALLIREKMAKAYRPR